MQQITFRGLEMHSTRMWQWQSVKTALSFMQRYGLNALIFHQNDIMDDIAMPQCYFSDADMVWKRWPIRRSKTYANAVYLRQVIKLAKSMGIDVYLEAKEIWYPEAIVELYPHLRDENGVVCPTNPFWFEFLKNKTEEVLDKLPDLAGIIVSPATRESKVSISKRSCPCKRCEEAADEAWYRQYIQALWSPLEKRDKTLVVRDFSYTADQQDALMRAVRSCSKKIVVALKNVPHDFWPTFPNNPQIGRITDMRQWIEFDVWGQYMGIGLFPCGLAEDLQKRLQYCCAHGASGVIFRTDWEICNDASTFNSFSMLNLLAGAMLSQQPDLSLDEVYRAWADYGLYSPLHTESEAYAPVRVEAEDGWKKLRDFMREAYSILEKTLYVRGNVFQLSSKIQYSIDDIFYTMVKHHSKSRWDESGEDTLAFTEENIGLILREKQEAVERAQKLESILQPDTLGLPEAFRAELHTLLDLFALYVEQFYHAAAVVFTSKATYLEDLPAKLTQANNALEAFAYRLADALEGSHYPHYVYWLLDAEQILVFVQNNRRYIRSLEESETEE